MHRYGWIREFSGGKENAAQEAARLRELLKAPLDGRINQKQSSAALLYWRTRIEERLGILTFQFSSRENELDGFSYALDIPPYAIALNNQRPYVRRIFTLFHELSHILKRKSGMCKPDFLEIKSQFEIELECNAFAGEFLVPGRSIRKAGSVDEIFELARFFNISGEVYLRRLLEEKKIEKDTFFRWLNEVRERSNSFSRTKHEGGPSMLIQSKSTRGKTFFSLVTNAAVTNKISFSTAADLLGLKAGNIGK